MTNRTVTLYGGPLDNTVEVVRGTSVYLFLPLHRGRRACMGEVIDDAAIYKEHGIGFQFEKLASSEKG